MVIHTGNRTDIPAFYSEWFRRRLKEGYVMVRNPYNEHSVNRYRLSPDVVDLIVFCTKNPHPLLPFPPELEAFRQYWFVTITPYGRDIEPNVPPYEKVLEDFRTLSKALGTKCVAWRYDPILIDDTYTVEKHIEAFEKMASYLSGYTEVCIISFIDLYEKVKKNYPEVREVTQEEEITLVKEFVRIGRKYGIRIKSCAEGERLAPYAVDTSGCMTLKIYEEAIGRAIKAPVIKNNRALCACYLTCDIGAYNTCMHFCRYCYANFDKGAVRRNHALHDPSSPLLIGHLTAEDKVHEAEQHSWIMEQLSLDL